MSLSVSTNPGGYGGVKSPNPPTIWFVPRDPTVNDWQNKEIGDEWINVAQGIIRWFKLLSLENNQAIWIRQVSTDTISGIAVQTGTTPVIPTIGGIVTFNGAVVAAGTNPVRTDGTGPNTVALEVQISQAIASSNATTIGLSAFNSAHFSVDSNGFVGLLGGGQAIDSIAVQTGTTPIVPTIAGLVTINGAVVAAGTNPVRTDGTGANTMAVEVQISQAIASTNATNIGLSAFNSSHFSVDANGFVSLLGGGQAIDSIMVDAVTPPGVNPVTPSSTGLITVTGGQVASGSTIDVIQTNSLAANTYTIQIQRSKTEASSTVGSNGVSHFNSSMFTVDTDGFVQLANYSNQTTTTADATPNISMTIPLGAIPGVYTFDINVSAFDTTNTQGAGFSIFGAVRTTGAAGVLIGEPDKIVNQEASLATSDVNLTVSGNNAIIEVTGVAATNIDWRSITFYTFIS